MAVTVLSGAESAPQLLGVETPKVKVKLLSRARLFVTPWIVACTKLLCPWDFQGKSTGVRFPASSVLVREGAGRGSVGDVPGAWLASAPLWPSLWT